MGKSLKRILMFVTFVCMVIGISKTNVSAESLKVQVVDNFENESNPETTEISIYGIKTITAFQFTLTEAGAFQGYVQIPIGTYGSGSVWISTDYEGNSVVAKEVALSGTGTITACLDPGTYYIQLRWNQMVTKVGLALLFERGNSQEDCTNSSFSNANTLSLDTYKKGYLTINTPKDFYEFVLEETAIVEIQYNFDTTFCSGSETGELKLYNSKQIEIGSGYYGALSSGIQTLEYKLEPGHYFISLTGMYGATALYVKPMYYETTLTPSTTKWTDENVTVKIDTTIDFSSIEVIRYNATEADLTTDSLWNTTSTDSKYVKLNGTSFVAKKNGTYSVRIKDSVGEYTLAQIKISNIDKKSPTVKGVKDGVYYNSNRTIVFNDGKGSGIKKATLNGKSISSGTKVTKEGEYTLKLYDLLGNKTTVKFYIDKTAPVIEVSQDGKYTKITTVSILDEYLGIKKITINGEEEASNNSPYYFTVKGTYKIKVWDLADNVTEKTIKVQ